MQAKLLPFALKCAKSTKNFRKYLKFIFYVSTSRLDHQDVCKIVETLNKYLLLSSAKCPFQTVKYYFCAGNFSVVNGSCAEIRQSIWENSENLESLDRLKWHFQSFLYLFSQGPTRKRQNSQNKSLVHQKDDSRLNDGKFDKMKEIKGNKILKENSQIFCQNRVFSLFFLFILISWNFESADFVGFSQLKMRGQKFS